MPRLIVPVALALLLLVGLLADPSTAASAPGEAEIAGTVSGFAEGVDEPLSDVRVELRPVAPLRGRDKRPASDLIGLAITDASGSFVINELNSASRRKSYPLMPDWTYEAKVVASGHYVFHGVVAWYGEGEPWEFMLEAKVTDVVDDSGVVAPEDRDLQRGATRRGGQ